MKHLKTLQEETEALMDLLFTGIYGRTDFQKPNLHHTEEGDPSQLKHLKTKWKEEKGLTLTLYILQGDIDALTFNPPSSSFGGCMLIPNGASRHVSR